MCAILYICLDRKEHIYIYMFTFIYALVFMHKSKFYIYMLPYLLAYTKVAHIQKMYFVYAHRYERMSIEVKFLYALLYFLICVTFVYARFHIYHKHRSYTYMEDIIYICAVLYMQIDMEGYLYQSHTYVEIIWHICMLRDLCSYITSTHTQNMAYVYSELAYIHVDMEVCICGSHTYMKMHS